MGFCFSNPLEREREREEREAMKCDGTRARLSSCLRTFADACRSYLSCGQLMFVAYERRGAQMCERGTYHTLIIICFAIDSIEGLIDGIVEFLFLQRTMWTFL